MTHARLVDRHAPQPAQGERGVERRGRGLLALVLGRAGQARAVEGLGQRPLDAGIGDLAGGIQLEEGEYEGTPDYDDGEDD